MYDCGGGNIDVMDWQKQRENAAKRVV